MTKYWVRIYFVILQAIVSVGGCVRSYCSLLYQLYEFGTMSPLLLQPFIPGVGVEDILLHRYYSFMSHRMRLDRW
jgi:hypothetical protein